ncbi:MAG: methylmalonyl-CoA mutase, partial [Chloroflexi bacterium]|nr:methylmalonyl-CoA mutase [Chloroflexota bacterium]
EALTNRMEEGALDYFRRIEEVGGVYAGIEQGFFQREIAEAAFHYQRQLEEKEKVMVGVNEFCSDQPIDIPILRIDPEVERAQVRRLRELKASRDSGRVDRSLAALRAAAERGENLMPSILEAVRAYATVQEASDAMKAVLGSYREPAFV